MLRSLLRNMLRNKQYDTITNMTRNTIIIILTLVITGAIGGFVSYSTFSELKEDLSKKEETINSANENISQLEGEKEDLVIHIEETESELERLEDEVKNLRGGLDLLSKLTTIDPEILKKYSRIYFLSENYRPDKLTQISKKYWCPEDNPEFVNSDMWPHLKDLLERAKRDGIQFQIISAFRTFDEQKDLKNMYDTVYGAGTANQFSAVQGYSEHQLGTAIDFTTKELSTSFESFESTDAYEWLQDNAYKYGFILSYPKDNKFYQFEPWHWRFIGRELAGDLHKKHMSFYEMDQNEIDTYRINIFED